MTVRLGTKPKAPLELIESNQNDRMLLYKCSQVVSLK